MTWQCMASGLRSLHCASMGFGGGEERLGKPVCVQSCRRRVGQQSRSTDAEFATPSNSKLPWEFVSRLRGLQNSSLETYIPYIEYAKPPFKKACFLQSERRGSVQTALAASTKVPIVRIHILAPKLHEITSNNALNQEHSERPSSSQDKPQEPKPT